jgi:raffinose/stachyose/melibiose transport system substrate-binding protein
VLALGEAGLLADASSQAFAGSLPDAYAPLVTLNGKAFGVFPTATAVPVFYNVDALDSAGLDIPRTWDGFQNLCAALKSKGLIPLGGGFQDNISPIFVPYAIYASVVDADDFETRRRDNEVRFADSGWTEVLDKSKQLADEQHFGDNPLGISSEQSLANFVAGKTAMVVGPSPALESFIGGRAAGSVGAFCLPGVDDETAVRLSAGVSYGYCVSSRTRARDTAFAFLEFLSRPTSVTALTKGGSIPAAGGSSGLVPQFQPLKALIEAGRLTPVPDTYWPSQRVLEALGSGMQKLYGGRASVAQVLDEMDAAYR